MPKNLSLEPKFDEHNDDGPPSTSAQNPATGKFGGVTEFPLFAPEHNMSKGALGGDNRTDLGRVKVYGNPMPGAVMPDSASITEFPQGSEASPNNAQGEEVARWFRGSSKTV